MKRQAGEKRPSRTSGSTSTSIPKRQLQLSLGPVRLPALAAVPKPCRGWVISASSEGRMTASEPASAILDRLWSVGFATLEIDLLHSFEASDPLIRFDIPLLSERLIATTDWLRHSNQAATSRVAYLAVGNAAAAALWSSVQRGNHVAATVSLCGRPHLAEPFLGNVTCPTLLLVEGQDARLLHMNRQAKRRLHCPSKLVAVSATNRRQERDGRRKLTHETVQWIESHLEKDKAETGTLSALVKNGFGLRLKRHLLAIMAVSSFFLAVPQPARASTDEKIDGKLKKEEDFSSDSIPKSGRRANRIG